MLPWNSVSNLVLARTTGCTYFQWIKCCSTVGTTIMTPWCINHHFIHGSNGQTVTVLNELNDIKNQNGLVRRGKLKWVSGHRWETEMAL